MPNAGCGRLGWPRATKPRTSNRGIAEAAGSNESLSRLRRRQQPLQRCNQPPRMCWTVPANATSRSLSHLPLPYHALQVNPSIPQRSPKLRIVDSFREEEQLVHKVQQTPTLSKRVVKTRALKLTTVQLRTFPNDHQNKKGVMAWANF